MGVEVHKMVSVMIMVFRSFHHQNICHKMVIIIIDPRCLIVVINSIPMIVIIIPIISIPLQSNKDKSLGVLCKRGKHQAGQVQPVQASAAI